MGALEVTRASHNHVYGDAVFLGPLAHTLMATFKMACIWAKRDKTGHEYVDTASVLVWCECFLNTPVVSDYEKLFAEELEKEVSVVKRLRSELFRYVSARLLHAEVAARASRDRALGYLDEILARDVFELWEYEPNTLAFAASWLLDHEQAGATAQRQRHLVHGDHLQAVELMHWIRSNEAIDPVQAKLDAGVIVSELPGGSGAPLAFATLEVLARRAGLGLDDLIAGCVELADRDLVGDFWYLPRVTQRPAKLRLGKVAGKRGRRMELATRLRPRKADGPPVRCVLPLCEHAIHNMQFPLEQQLSGDQPPRLVEGARDRRTLKRIWQSGDGEIASILELEEGVELDPTSVVAAGDRIHTVAKWVKTAYPEVHASFVVEVHHADGRVDEITRTPGGSLAAKQ